MVIPVRQDQEGMNEAFVAQIKEFSPPASSAT